MREFFRGLTSSEVTELLALHSIEVTGEQRADIRDAHYTAALMNLWSRDRVKASEILLRFKSTDEEGDDPAMDEALARRMVMPGEKGRRG